MAVLARSMDEDVETAEVQQPATVEFLAFQCKQSNTPLSMRGSPQQVQTQIISWVSCRITRVISLLLLHVSQAGIMLV